MKTIKLGNSTYEYMLSGAAVIQHGKYLSRLAQQEEKGQAADITEMVERFYEILHTQLVSGREAQPAWRRWILNLIRPVPSVSRLYHLIEFSEVQSILGGQQGMTEEEDTPENHPK